MRVRLAVAALVNSVYINVQANMAAGGGAPNKHDNTFLTNRKLTSNYSESLPRRRSKAITYVRSTPKKVSIRSALSVSAH